MYDCGKVKSVGLKVDHFKFKKVNSLKYLVFSLLKYADNPSGK